MMGPGFLLPILVKAVSTGLVVVGASVLAEVMGPFGAALVSSLPISTGPAYVFMSMQHGTGYMAATALNGFAANASTGVFLIVHAKLGMRRPLAVSLGAALLAWFAMGVFICNVAWTPLSGLALNVVVYGIGFAIVRRQDIVVRPLGARPVRRWQDLPVRAVAVALFVTVVTQGSTMLGPAVTGLATTFPMAFSCMIYILHPRMGGGATALLAATALRSMLGFGLMLLTVHYTMRPWGPALSLPAGLLVSLAWSGGLILMQRRPAIFARPAPHTGPSRTESPRR